MPPTKGVKNQSWRESFDVKLHIYIIFVFVVGTFHRTLNVSTKKKRRSCRSTLNINDAWLQKEKLWLQRRDISSEAGPAPSCSAALHWQGSARGSRSGIFWRFCPLPEVWLMELIGVLHPRGTWLLFLIALQSGNSICLSVVGHGAGRCQCTTSVIRFYGGATWTETMRRHSLIWM